MPPLRLLLSCALISFGAMVCAPAAAAPASPAVSREAAVNITVIPDRSDWTYAPGATARFRVTVSSGRQPLTNLPIRYTLGPETRPGPARDAVISENGYTVIEGTLDRPGFLRCTIHAEVDGRAHQGHGTAGYTPTAIEPSQSEPEDFDAFWQQQKTLLREVPLDPILTRAPELSTEAVTVYHVSVQTAGSGPTSQPTPRVYGMLCEPTAPGRYPALLRVPGAGVRPYQGLRDLAARGIITFEIGVHGLPVNLPTEVYDQLRAGALNGYWTYGVTDRDTYYYRRVVLSSLRAAEFLRSRPQWNRRNLAVGGESQGGMLAIATAALDPEITALHAIAPAFCDLAAPLHGRTGGWPHLLEQPAFRDDPRVIKTLRYYDTVNFARRLKTPGYYAWGYNDDVCPPTSLYAAYNVIRAPKQLLLDLEMTHRTSPDVYRAVDFWVLRQLGVE